MVIIIGYGIKDNTKSMVVESYVLMMLRGGELEKGMSDDYNDDDVNIDTGNDDEYEYDDSDEKEVKGNWYQQ